MLLVLLLLCWKLCKSCDVVSFNSCFLKEWSNQILNFPFADVDAQIGAVLEIERIVPKSQFTSLFERVEKWWLRCDFTEISDSKSCKRRHEPIFANHVLRLHTSTVIRTPYNILVDSTEPHPTAYLPHKPHAFWWVCNLCVFCILHPFSHAFVWCLPSFAGCCILFCGLTTSPQIQSKGLSPPPTELHKIIGIQSDPIQIKISIDPIWFYCLFQSISKLYSIDNLWFIKISIQRRASHSSC